MTAPAQQQPATAGDALTGELSTLEQDLRAADSFQDPRLTSVALNAHRESLRAEATARALQAVASIATDTAQVARAAREAAGRFAFRADAVDAGSAGLAWQHNIQPALETGANPDWQRIIGNAGPDDLAAIMKYGPAWLRRNSKLDGLGEHKDRHAALAMHDIENAVQLRHFELHPDARAREALTLAESAIRTATTAAGIASQLQRGLVRNRAHVAGLLVSAKSLGINR